MSTSVAPLSGDQQKRLLILLLGGRIQPAAMLAFQQQPDAVVCIHSADEPQTAPQLKALLRKRFPQIRIGRALPVGAYQPAETRAAIAQALTAFPEHQPALSLTGAPMPMVIGAYTMAQRLGCPAYYLNTADGQILDLALLEAAAQPETAAPAAFTLQLTVADYLTIQGQQWVNEGEMPFRLAQTATYRRALQLLLADLPTTTALLDWLMERRTGALPQRRAWTLGANHWACLTQLHDLGLCQEVAMLTTPKTTYVRCSVPDAAHRQFLSGGWLEWAVEQAAQAAGCFDDCTHGVVMRSGNAQREVDFIGVRRGQGLIASCKTGWRFWNKAYLDELSAAARTLGDNYCTKLFVTHRLKPPASTPGAAALPPFLNHAMNQRMVVVLGADLPRLAAILQQECSKPTYARR